MYLRTYVRTYTVYVWILTYVLYMNMRTVHKDEAQQTQSD